MGLDWVWVAVGAASSAGALFVCFCFGVVVGYAWRDRISHKRRLRVEQERKLEELDGALALALSEAMPTGHSNGNPANEALAGSFIDEAIGVSQPTVSRARRHSTGTDVSVDKRTGHDGSVRRHPKKPGLKVVTGDILQ